MPTLTAELYTIPLDAGQYLVYAPRRLAAFVTNARMVNLLADVGDGLLETSVQDEEAVEFLRRLEIVDGGPEPDPVETYSGDPQPTSVTLFLTTVCNLRCTYCYASAGDRPVKSMNIETAKRGIDFVVNNALKKGLREFGVGFHGGGEPTVLWSVLTQSLAYARARSAETGLILQASSATNGVLTDSQIDWIIANLNSLTISFDGLPEAQDKHRLTVLGQGSSQRVVHTLKRLDRAGYPYSIRATVTADNIALLPDSVEYIFSNFFPRYVQVEPSYQLGRWTGAPSAETAEFLESFRQARERARRHGRDLSYSAARVGTLTNHFCGISRDSFSLSPDGNVSACFEVFAEDLPLAEHFFYGSPSSSDSGYLFNASVLSRLRGQSVEHRAYCSGCFARWSCAGDCYHKALSETGSEEFVGTERCHITRELTKDQILDRIAASGGLFWHEAQTRSAAAIAEETDGHSVR